MRPSGLEWPHLENLGALILLLVMTGFQDRQTRKRVLTYTKTVKESCGIRAEGNSERTKQRGSSMEVIKVKAIHLPYPYTGEPMNPVP